MDAVPEFDEIEDYCTFGPERVYVLLAIARSKEHDAYSSNTEPVIREVVEDAAELRQKVEQLDHATSRFDARFRLYLSANARNTTKAFFELRRSMDEWLEMRLNGNEEILGKFKSLDSEFKSVLQRDTCKDETNFVFDLDDVSAADAETFRDRVREHTEVLLTRETPNGFHVCTGAFNYNELDAAIEYELQTDGMLFLSYVGE